MDSFRRDLRTFLFFVLLADTAHQGLRGNALHKSAVDTDIDVVLADVSTPTLLTGIFKGDFDA